jgi:hypothetical protein
MQRAMHSLALEGNPVSGLPFLIGALHIELTLDLLGPPVRYFARRSESQCVLPQYVKISQSFSPSNSHVQIQIPRRR